MTRHSGQNLEKYLSVICGVGLAPSPKLLRDHVEDLFQGIDLEGKRMLDIGGGSGMYSFFAACVGGSAVCLEPEGEGAYGDPLQVFRRISAQLPDASVRLVTQTIQDYTADGMFDVIVMYSSINHLDEDACVGLLDDAGARERYKRIFTHIYSMANPGAQLIVSDCSRKNFFAALKLKNPLRPTIEWQKHHTPETWARLLEEAGFRNPRIRWEPMYRLGTPGRVLLTSRAASYFFKSTFHLRMEKA